MQIIIIVVVVVIIISLCASKCGLTENRRKSAKYRFALTF